MITLLTFNLDVFDRTVFLLAQKLGKCFSNRLFLLEWLLDAQVILLLIIFGFEASIQAISIRLLIKDGCAVFI